MECGTDAPIGRGSMERCRRRFRKTPFSIFTPIQVSGGFSSLYGGACRRRPDFQPLLAGFVAPRLAVAPIFRSGGIFDVFVSFFET